MNTRKVENEEFSTYSSGKLKFTISFPAGWEVRADTLYPDSKDVTPEQAYAAFQKAFPDPEFTLEDFKGKQDELETRTVESAEEAYNRLKKKHGADLVDFPEFKTIYEQGIEEQTQWARRRDELEQMMIGNFEATPVNSDDEELGLLVTKLRLSKPLNALELYELDKPLQEDVPWGNRPSKGMIVDGLHGVKYYYVLDNGETTNSQEWPKYFNVYLAESDNGWIISCTCKVQSYDNFKPFFDRIIGSFRRN